MVTVMNVILIWMVDAAVYHLALHYGEMVTLGDVGNHEEIAVKSICSLSIHEPGESGV